MFKNFKYTLFNYEIKVYNNDINIAKHFIVETRYLKAILKVLKMQNLDAIIKDKFNNKATLENMLTQLES